MRVRIREGFVNAALPREPAGAFRHNHEKHQKRGRRQNAHAKHRPPDFGDHDPVPQAAANPLRVLHGRMVLGKYRQLPIREVGDEKADDDRQLISRNEPAANMRWRDSEMYIGESTDAVPMPTPAMTREVNNCQYSGATAQPIDDRKKRTAETISTGLRPKWSPAAPATAAPAMQPNRADAANRPFAHSSRPYCFCTRSTAPEITAVSKPKQQAADRGHEADAGEIPNAAAGG